MAVENLHDFFVASASVAGALIGLLFVALSVAAQRLTTTEEGGQLHRIRASAALTAFTNSLVISLLSLIPDDATGATAVAVGSTGLLFVVASLLSLVRVHQIDLHTLRESVFLFGLIIVFVVQLIRGVALIGNPDDADALDTIAVLVTICFLLGIGRSWELVGGPSIGFRREVVAIVRGHDDEADQPPSTEAKPD